MFVQNFLISLGNYFSCTFYLDTGKNYFANISDKSQPKSKYNGENLGPMRYCSKLVPIYEKIKSSKISCLLMESENGMMERKKGMIGSNERKKDKKQLIVFN